MQLNATHCNSRLRKVAEKTSLSCSPMARATWSARPWGRKPHSFESWTCLLTCLLAYVLAYLLLAYLFACSLFAYLLACCFRCTFRLLFQVAT